LVDKRAQKILLDAFWKSGWKSDGADAPELSDIEYAKSEGYWFDPIEVSHDVLVEWLITLKESVSARDVGNAFLASLSTRRLELRSALASYAFISSFPKHSLSSSPHSKVPSGAEVCHICGFYNFPETRNEDLNVLNFERHKWGGVRHDDPLYTWFDLSRFRELDYLEPTKDDYDIMRKILDISTRISDDARPSALAKDLSGIIESNDAERRVLVEILSFCGVLQPRNESGYFGEFTIASERRDTNEHTNDWGYPAIWWRGADGVNAAAVSTYFPDI